MNTIALFGSRMAHRVFCISFFSRKLCDWSFDYDSIHSSGFQHFEESLKRECRVSGSDSFDNENRFEYHPYPGRRKFFDDAKNDAARVLDVLRQDVPGFDLKGALKELRLQVSGLLVRHVLVGILVNINNENKTRSAKLACKFFDWASHQDNYRHTANGYHLMMKILGDCEEYKAMWRLLDEMIDNGFPTTARTFNILICTCAEAGLARVLVERFVKSKTFNYRPFKHSYNAILHSLLVVGEYRLVEWVHQQMLAEGYAPDILTYNIILCAKYRLEKKGEFERLADEMLWAGFVPDFHTYNILLFVLGKQNKPCEAAKLLNHMQQVGLNPSILHFTTLMDGLSRAGNIEHSRHFFDEMIKKGLTPDAVCYTVMITGYVVAGEVEKGEEMFNEMIARGQLPNVCTYNSMIQGLCMVGRFEDACSMLKEMEFRGCTPNFRLYKTMVRNLKNAGKHSEASKIIKEMIEKGNYANRLNFEKVQDMVK